MRSCCRERKWLVAPWLVVLVGAATVAFLASNADSGKPRASTQNFDPKEAAVTIEDGDVKAVHLTSSKFMWQFRDDQPAEEVWGYNEQIPGPTLRFPDDDNVRIYYTNHLDEASTIHRQGLIVPNSMDGVGGLTMPPIMPARRWCMSSRSRIPQARSCTTLT